MNRAHGNRSVLSCSGCSPRTPTSAVPCPSQEEPSIWGDHQTRGKVRSNPGLEALPPFLRWIASLWSIPPLSDGDPEIQKNTSEANLAPQQVFFCRCLRRLLRNTDGATPRRSNRRSASLTLVFTRSGHFFVGILDLTVLDMCSRAAPLLDCDGAGGALGLRGRATEGDHRALNLLLIGDTLI